MDISVLLAFTLASVALVFMPGVDIFFVLSSSLTKGFKTGFYLSLGLASGIIVHTVLCASGVSLIVASSPILFNVVRIGGASYLAYLAFLTFRSKPEVFSLSTGAEVQPFGKLYLRGFLMNVSNPKVIIFFLSFFPQFLRDGTVPAWGQICVFGVILMMLSLSGFTLVAFASEKISALFSSLLFAKIMRWLTILVFGGISISLVAELFN